MTVQDVQGIRNDGPAGKAGPSVERTVLPEQGVPTRQVSDRVTLSLATSGTLDAPQGQVVDVPYEIVSGPGEAQDFRSAAYAGPSTSDVVPAGPAPFPDPSSLERMSLSLRTEQWARTAEPLRTAGERKPGSRIDIRI